MRSTSRAASRAMLSVFVAASLALGATGVSCTRQAPVSRPAPAVTGGAAATGTPAAYVAATQAPPAARATTTETPPVARVAATQTPQLVRAAAASAAGPLDAVQIARQARPAVVNVTTSVMSQSQFRQPVPVQEGVGTGIIVDQQGYVLTNSHVVRAGAATPARSISVTLDDGRTLAAAVIDDDPLNDLAILKIGGGPFPTLPLGDSAAAMVGEPVVAIGQALALPGGPTVTTGVVSAVGRSIDEPNGVTLPDLLQTDAAINPGNSGGPLLNARGEVIGINTVGSAQAQGISFAVAINQAKPAIESAAATGRVVRPSLGVAILGAVTPAIARANGLPAQRGVAVLPDPNGPAAAAGLRAGDIIVAVDGQPVTAVPDLTAAIRAHRPGDRLQLSVQRSAGPPLVLTATLTAG